MNAYKFSLPVRINTQNSLATVAENYFFSKHSRFESYAHRWGNFVIESAKHPNLSLLRWQLAAGVYAVSWVVEYSRATFHAMTLKETCASAGSRITPR
ncbi:MAG: DUF3604 domain-containing protein [Rhizobiaceae bacterium]